MNPWYNVDPVPRAIRQTSTTDHPNIMTSLPSSLKIIYQGVNVDSCPDQDSTDFMKCVELVRALDPSPSSSASPSILSSETTAEILEKKQKVNLGVVALGGNGGRFDQTMSSIHHLYILNRERHACLVSNDSLIVVLGPVSLFDLMFNFGAMFPVTWIFGLSLLVA